jgi:hypothetical protein
MYKVSIGDQWHPLPLCGFVTFAFIGNIALDSLFSYFVVQLGPFPPPFFLTTL